jgi:D-alanine-D-alanine ligase
VSVKPQSLSIALVYNLAAQWDRVDVNSVVDGVTSIQATLEALGHQVTLMRVSEGIPQFVQQIAAAQPDLIFNLCEGFGEHSSGEYCVAGLLELLGTPYTGSGPFALALALDKPTAKRLFTAAGMLTPAFSVCREGSAMPPGLSYPIILKLAGEDASLGITAENLVHDEAACRARLTAMFAEHHAAVLAEEFIEGREFTVALLDREPIALEEIVFSVEPRILCHSAKWAVGSAEDLGTRAVYDPPVTAAQQAAMFDLAIRACDVIGTRDYSRVDFRMNDRGEIYVLEVNPNPDITPNSGYRGSLQSAGISFDDFVTRMISCALNRSDGGVRFSVIRR